MGQCTADVTTYLQQVILYSGRGPNFKGNYEMCVDHPALNYALVEFGIGGVDAGAAMGFCLPRSCSDAEVTEGIDGLLAAINSTFSVYSVDSHIADYRVPMDWLSYLTIAFLGALAVLAIWATFRSLRKGKTHSNALLAAFDVRENMGYFKVRGGQLDVMDGVRAIAMMWVVIGHAFSFSLASGPINLPNIDTVADKPFFLLIEAGLLAVDIFFMLGGFFLAFAVLREKITGFGSWGMAVVMRVLRIWPAYITAMVFYYSLFMQTGGGVLWSRAWNDVSMCRSMWREVLFVANMIDRGKEACLGWGWYLQVDFQLFLASLLLLFLYLRSRRAAFALAVACMAASTAFNVTFTLSHNVPLFTNLAAFANFEDFMLDLYEKPWGRCTPYFMGLLLGILYMELRKAKKENAPETTLLGKLANACKRKAIRLTIEWVGIGIMAFVAFIPRCLQTGGCEWPQLVHSFYWGLSKPVFLLGMTMCMLPSMLGQVHSFLNLLLTSKAFMFIARISFCTYLVHLMVLYHFILSRDYDIYYNIPDTFHTYLGMLVASLIVGFIATLFIELPFANLLKNALGKHKDRAKAKQKEAKEMHDSLITEEEGGSMVGKEGKERS